MLVWTMPDSNLVIIDVSTQYVYNSYSIYYSLCIQDDPSHKNLTCWRVVGGMLHYEPSNKPVYKVVALRQCLIEPFDPAAISHAILAENLTYNNAEAYLTYMTAASEQDVDSTRPLTHQHNWCSTFDKVSQHDPYEHVPFHMFLLHDELRRYQLVSTRPVLCRQCARRLRYPKYISSVPARGIDVCGSCKRHVSSASKLAPASS